MFTNGNCRVSVRKLLILAVLVVVTVLVPAALAQTSEIRGQLAAMELTLFSRAYCKDTPIRRIERLEENFVEPSKQKEKDLPTRINELMDKIQPAERLLRSADPCSDASTTRHSALQKFENGTRKMADQAKGMPRSIMSGTRRVLSPLLGDGMGDALGNGQTSTAGSSSWSAQQNTQYWRQPAAPSYPSNGGYNVPSSQPMYSRQSEDWESRNQRVPYPQSEPVQQPFENDSTAPNNSAEMTEESNERTNQSDSSPPVEPSEFQPKTSREVSLLSDTEQQRYSKQFNQWLETPPEWRFGLAIVASTPKASERKRKVR